MSIDEDKAHFINIRSDPAKTAARYDEIIRLRLLLVMLKGIASRPSTRKKDIIDAIESESKKWGGPDDWA